MKNLKFFLLLILILSIVSCSKRDNNSSGGASASERQIAKALMDSQKNKTLNETGSDSSPLSFQKVLSKKNVSSIKVLTSPPDDFMPDFTKYEVYFMDETQSVIISEEDLVNGLFYWEMYDKEWVEGYEISKLKVIWPNTMSKVFWERVGQIYEDIVIYEDQYTKTDHIATNVTYADLYRAPDDSWGCFTSISNNIRDVFTIKVSHPEHTYGFPVGDYVYEGKAERIAGNLIKISGDLTYNNSTKIKLFLYWNENSATYEGILNDIYVQLSDGTILRPEDI